MSNRSASGRSDGSGTRRPGTLRLGALLLPFLIAAPVVARDKSDTVTLGNGDRITCEIKELNLGVLRASTDHMSTVSIEWIGVQSVQTSQLFEVEDDAGIVLFGIIVAADEEGALAVVGPTGIQTRPLSAIVRIDQLEDDYWKRWNGGIDFGFSFASANSQTDSTVDASATYRARRFSVRNSISATISERDGAASSNRGSLTSTYERLLGDRWLWLASVDLTTNDELDLDLRTSLVGAYGRFVVQTPRSQLAVAGGLSAIREAYVDLPEEWSYEAVLYGGYDLFVFEGRETSLSIDLRILPSLSTSGRLRIEFSSSFRRKLVRDFTLAVTLEESYDSKPLGEDAKQSDTRLRTTLGWTF
jgi:putative salt-induced outer membrane protein YdiY